MMLLVWYPEEHRIQSVQILHQLFPKAFVRPGLTCGDYEKMAVKQKQYRE